MFGWFLPIYRPDKAKPAEWKVEYEIPEDEDDETKLRDWFAGQALTGLAADTSNVHAHLMAKAAYIIADRMLEERKRRDDK